jgi:structural maintenance of chromosomes protein 5
LLSRVNTEYQRIMSQTLATGEVQLSTRRTSKRRGWRFMWASKVANPWRWMLTRRAAANAQPQPWVSSCIAAACPQPFRAVDEYDIHMDPKNREMIAKVLVAMIKDSAAQYVVITPSQITFAQQDANVITVQNIEGKSVVREMAK